MTSVVTALAPCPATGSASFATVSFLVSKEGKSCCLRGELLEQSHSRASCLFGTLTIKYAALLPVAFKCPLWGEE